MAKTIKRTVNLSVRTTVEFKELIEQKATELNMTMSAFTEKVLAEAIRGDNLPDAERII